MRNLHILDKYRRKDPACVAYFGGVGDDTCGAFVVPSPIDSASMMIIASSEAGWDHVSVSRVKRPPNWAEMSHVKRLFFLDVELVVQYHVPASEHINVHENCLHLWRCRDVEFPRPPGWMVGGSRSEADAAYDAEMRKRGYAVGGKP